MVNLRYLEFRGGGVFQTYRPKDMASHYHLEWLKLYTPHKLEYLLQASPNIKACTCLLACYVHDECLNVK